jgi:putative choline sulfate-utilization transcription factor
MANPHRLPPLQCLVFFEAAGRHLNFTAAAQELGTTQPAVSQRITRLEDDLGTPLFMREHRGVSLTADGIHLFEAVHQSLAAIGKTTAKIRSRRTRQVLTVTTDFGFASYWLMPRLGAMRDLVPELDVRIVTSQNEFDVHSEAGDLAIAFGSGRWPGCEVEMLFPEIVIPVCSPGFFVAHIAGAPEPDLTRLPLLHLESPGPVRWLTWDRWFALQGLPAIGGGHDLTLNNYPLVIQAAIAGQGVALGWVPLIDELVKGGQLVVAVDRPTKTEHGCFLLQPDSQRPSASLGKFRQWIRRECDRALADSAFDMR